MKDYKILSANAEYTGGNIYCYTAKLDNGNYLMGSSEWDALYMVDTDPDSTEDSYYDEWMDEHMVSELEGKVYYKYIVKVLRWIIDNEPKGNYSTYDIEINLDFELSQSKMGKTEKTLAKLPLSVNDHIEKFKKDYSKHGNEVKFRAMGYLLALVDTNVIEDSDRRTILSYITL